VLAERHERAAEIHATTAFFLREGGAVAKAQREEQQLARQERDGAERERRHAEPKRH